MHRSKKARLQPTALVSIAGLLLWAACSSKENDFFNTPPIVGAGQSGTSSSAGKPSAGNTASGGANAASGAGGSSTPKGGTGGDSSDTGGSSSLGGTHATGGADAVGGTGASGGSDTGGAGDGDGSGGVMEGGAPSAGAGGDTVVSGGMSGSGGSSGSGGTSGVAGAASGAGGVSGTSGGGGTSGVAGAASGAGGVSGTGATSGAGGIAGTSGAAGSSAGAGGTSSPVTCSNDNGCQSGQFCAKSSCNAASGTCKPKPMECAGTDATFAPVCGCDHMTYYSPCVADREGTNVASQGECTGTTVACTRTDGGKSCNPARALARCYRPRTSCTGTSADSGVCWVMPDECPNEPQVNRYCGGLSGTPSCVGLCEGLFNEYPVWRDSNQCQ